MFADDLPFGDDNDAFGVDTHADRVVGKRCRHAVAIAVEMNEAGRRHALAVFHEAVNGRPSFIRQVASLAHASAMDPGWLPWRSSPHNALQRCSSQSFKP